MPKADKAPTTVVRLRAPETVERAVRTLHPSDPLRARLEAACERLEALAAEIIAELDLAAGDPDLEPSLGAPEWSRAYPRPWEACAPSSVFATDLEEACEDEGGACEDEGAATGDDEPWLAAPEGAQAYGEVRCGDLLDREHDAALVEVR